MSERATDATGPAPGDEIGLAALVDRIAARERAIAALEAEQARDLAAFSERRVAGDRAAGVPDHLVGRTVGTELALALRVGQQSAANRVAQADMMVRHHPRLLGLVGTGHVSMTGVRLVLRHTTELTDDVRRVVDAQVADLAADEQLTPARLAQASARFALAADPEAAAKRAAAARARRRVWLNEPLDGVAGVGAVLRAEEALACWTALDRTARAMRQHGDERSVQTLMADLVVERLTGVALTSTAAEAKAAADMAVSVARPPVWRTIDGWEPWTATEAPPAPLDRHRDPEPDDPVWDTVDWTPADDGTDTDRDPPDQAVPDRNRPQWRLPASVELQVVMSAETLLGLDDEPALLRGPGGLAAYGPMAAQVAREIADAASRRTLIGLFADPIDGRLLTMDSTARFFTGRLRDFCVWRDQVCRVAGGRIAEVDHRTEVQEQGPTTAHNGQSMSRLSHRIKDHPGVLASVIDGATEPESAFRSTATTGLAALRASAPVLEWEMPTGHRYPSAPPPVLGPGARPDLAAWLDQCDERNAYREFVAAGDLVPAQAQ